MTGRDAIAQTGEQDRRYQELRLRVQQRRSAVADLVDLDGEDSRVEVAVEQLIEATDDLLDFEDRLPVLRDLPARAMSVQVVRAAALAAALGGVLLVLGIWRDLLGWGWSVAVLVTGVAALRTATMPVAPAAGSHRRQRYLAAVCGAAGLFVGPSAVLSGWPAALACLAVQVVSLGVLLELVKERS